MLSFSKRAPLSAPDIHNPECVHPVWLEDKDIVPFPTFCPSAATETTLARQCRRLKVEFFSANVAPIRFFIFVEKMLKVEERKYQKYIQWLVFVGLFHCLTLGRPILFFFFFPQPKISSQINRSCTGRYPPHPHIPTTTTSTTPVMECSAWTADNPNSSSTHAHAPIP